MKNRSTTSLTTHELVFIQSRTFGKSVSARSPSGVLVYVSILLDFAPRMAVVVGQTERWTTVVVAIVDGFFGRALRSCDLLALFDIVGGRSNGLVDECPVLIEIDRAAEFNRVDHDASGIDVKQEPQAFFAVA